MPSGAGFLVKNISVFCLSVHMKDHSTAFCGFIYDMHNVMWHDKFHQLMHVCRLLSSSFRQIAVTDLSKCFHTILKNKVLDGPPGFCISYKY